MIANSIYAVIERAVRKKMVYASSEWLAIISNVLYKPFPDTVTKLDHTDFSDHKQVGDEMNIVLDNGKKFKIIDIP